jgi:hypothetical protein
VLAMNIIANVVQMGTTPPHSVMNTYPYLVIGLAVFDVLLLICFYRYLRSHTPLDRRVLFPVAAGLIGFVFHALLFFSGAFLYMQLATIASIFGLCLFWSREHRERKSGGT